MFLPLSGEQPNMTDNPQANTIEQVEVARPKRKRRRRTKRQPPYHVILWDDDAHTYEYVIAMMRSLFGYPEEKGFQIAEEVDTRGRAIVITTTLEHAELKRDQIHAFGPDVLEKDCRGAMWATLEAATS